MNFGIIKKRLKDLGIPGAVLPGSFKKLPHMNYFFSKTFLLKYEDIVMYTSEEPDDNTDIIFPTLVFKKYNWNKK